MQTEPLYPRRSLRRGDQHRRAGLAGRLHCRHRSTAAWPRARRSWRLTRRRAAPAGGQRARWPRRSTSWSWKSRSRARCSRRSTEAQREHYLREQVKAIQTRAGRVRPADARDQRACARRSTTSGMPDDVAHKAEEEINRLSLLHQGSPEVGIIRTYLDWLLAVPWAKRRRRQPGHRGRRPRLLEENHYGLPKVKERILEFMAVRKLAGEKMRSPILCFVGPPGVGKTLARPLHRRGAGAQVRAHVAGRRARRGRDSRPPPHLRRRPARPHHPDDA